jgi:hypothetical protein
MDSGRQACKNPKARHTIISEVYLAFTFIRRIPSKGMFSKKQGGRAEYY